MVSAVSLWGLSAQAQPTIPEFEVRKDTSRAHNPYYVRGRVLIEAPREQVWSVLIDCDALEDIVPQVKSCEIEEQGMGWDMRRHRLKSGVFSVMSVLRSDYKYLEKVTMHRVGGGMKVHDGVWTLSAVSENVTELHYEAWSKPNFWVPDWVINEMMRNDVPVVLANLRERAENTPTGHASLNPDQAAKEMAPRTITYRKF